jgi:DNA-binding transcriptional MerR regulator
MPTGLREKRRTPQGRAAVPPKLFKIGEVMRYSGLSRQTVHNYTVMGLITERERTESGHRLYGEEVFTRLRRLEELKGRMTLLEIRQLFDSEGPGR